MRPTHNPEVIARMQTTFELCELAEAMMRQNLRRRYPKESAEQIERRVMTWLQDRPGAEHGDADGPFRVRRLFE
jgi:Rv0078B-related antitoxin